MWTNEDMGDVHNNSAISTFSATNNKPANGKPAGTAKGNKDAKQYQDQILKLQEKLPPLDEQITQLQAALNGDTVNSTRHVGGAKIDDWHDELVRAQKQREDIVAKISALQDEARRNGVPRESNSGVGVAGFERKGRVPMLATGTRPYKTIALMRGGGDFLFDGGADQIAPLGPGAVVILHVAEAE